MGRGGCPRTTRSAANLDALAVHLRNAANWRQAAAALLGNDCGGVTSVGLLRQPEAVPDSRNSSCGKVGSDSMQWPQRRRGDGHPGEMMIGGRGRDNWRVKCVTVLWLVTIDQSRDCIQCNCSGR